MARDLGISAAFLCQVLNSTRGLTESRAFDFAERLGWDSDKTRRFLTALRFSKAKDGPTRKKLLAELREWERVQGPHFDLDAAYFEAMSSWLHYAILELTTVEGFEPKATWIARRLGQTIVDTESAIRRLRSLGLLSTDGEKWTKTHPHYATPDDDEAYVAALRKFHDGVLNLGRRKVWDPQAEREFGSIVVSTDPAKLPLIKKKIRRFQEEMMVFMENAPRKAVYQMSVQLFRMDAGDKV